MPLTNLLQFSHREEPVRLLRSGFETIPSDLSKAELFRYCAYSAEDRLAIFECRGNNNKVSFALLLGGVRLTGGLPTRSLQRYAEEKRLALLRCQRNALILVDRHRFCWQASRDLQPRGDAVLQ